MAQKKDFSNGFEGRYRRTSSPSASPIRNSRSAHSQQPGQGHPLTHHSSTKCLNTYNNNYSALSSTSMLSSSTMALSSYPSNSSSGTSSLSSSLSSSSSKSKSGSYLKHSASSTSSSSNSSAGSSSAGPRQPIFNSLMKPPTLDNDNHVNNNENGWPAHGRQVSTTVDFTNENLRALRSNKQTGAGYYQSSSRTLPSAVSTPALLQQSSYGSHTSNQGSSSSLASASLDTPPKTSPETSLRASLDSLHYPRMPIVSRNRGVHDSLPRTVSVTETLSNDSLSRCTSAVESLSRSTSVADSLCRRSSSLAETPSSLSRTSSISETSASSPTSMAPSGMVIEGAVIARIATVTEESSVNSPTYDMTHETSEVDVSTIAEEVNFVSSPNCSPTTTAEDDSSVPSVTSHSSSSPPTVLSAEPEHEVSILPDLPASLPTECVSVAEGDDHSPTGPYNAPDRIVEESRVENPQPILRRPVDTVVIGYGRGRRPEELECDQLSMEYVSKLGLDPRLQALLGEYMYCRLMLHDIWYYSIKYFFPIQTLHMVFI